MIASSAIPVDLAIERNTPAAEWDSYLLQRPEATFFHQSSWLSVIERTFRFQTCSIAARRSGSLCGILPLYRIRLLPRGSALVSAPMAVYGGIVANDEESRDGLLREAQRLSETMGVQYLELRHLAPVGNLPSGTRYVTFQREIDPDPDVNMARIPRNQRRSIRVAIKHGLRSEIGGRELLDDFYGIYAESVRNLGSPVFPKALFARCLETIPSCRILAVRHEDRTVAGVLTFFYRDTVLPYYGGARKDAYRVSCNDYMYWSLMCHAAERGYRIFDFGRSKRGSGSYDFKRHWGFQPKPLAYQYHLVRARDLPDLSPMNPRFRLAIELWKRLPVGVARWIGPKLIRFFP